MSKPETEQSEISLKVLRLSKPSFSLKPHVFFDSTPGLATDALAAIQHNDPTSNHYQSPDQSVIGSFGLGAVLSMPSTFGNIYLGESFSCFVSTNNEHTKPIFDIGIKVELQTATQRFVLIDTVGTLNTQGIQHAITANPSSPRSRIKLEPGQSTDSIVNHEIKELGQHILVCSVHFTTEGERKYIRKFFKFLVLNPIGVKTKIVTMPNADVLMEVQIVNSAHCAVTLERIRFDASELFHFTDLNTIASIVEPIKDTHADLGEPTEKSPPMKSVFGDSSLLNVGDTRQYLYLLSPAISGDLIAASTSSLGKLDIGWRTSMGQQGRLQTATLSRKINPPPQFQLIATQIPSKITVEVPFQVECKLWNYGEVGRVSLRGVKTKMGSVMLSGACERTLGNIGSGCSETIVLTFFPLYAGLHRISGLQISDAISGTTVDIEYLIDVFVGNLECLNT